MMDVCPSKVSDARAVAALLGLWFLLAGCAESKKEKPDDSGKPSPAAVTDNATINYGVVRTHPHDTSAFTEGLQMHEGKLYESTGSPPELPQTRSIVGEVDLKTGRLLKKIEIDRKRYFGEGITFLKGHLYQLTYTSKIGFIYDAKTLKQVGTFTFPSKEGWGLATDGRHLIMSDGTPTLTYLDPVSFKTVRTVAVSGASGAVANLNELEYIKGFIYANIYTTPHIVKIDPQTGRVVGRMDLSALQQDAKNRNPAALEMNGIAYDPAAGSLYVTGKMWPAIYEIKIPM